MTNGKMFTINKIKNHGAGGLSGKDKDLRQNIKNNKKTKLIKNALK